MTRTLTKAAILGAAAMLIVWDVIVALNDIADDTISEVVLGWSFRYQSIPFAAGVLVSHLFWPSRRWKPRDQRRAEGWSLVFIAVAFVVIDVTLVGELAPIIPFLPGVLVGKLLWPQRAGV